MRITILIATFLLVLAGTTLAQSKPEAYKFAELTKMSDKGVKGKMEAFMIELANKATSQGYIISYGSRKAIALRRKQLTDAVTWLKLDPSRTTFVDGGFERIVPTAMWIVPPGAEPPKP